MVKGSGQEVRPVPLAGGIQDVSIRPSHVAALTSYIEDQAEHHKAVTFQDEYPPFLSRYEVAYDERYVWD